jgi:hypothetical protein
VAIEHAAPIGEGAFAGVDPGDVEF